MTILEGKNALIIGAASKRSIAYGIATAMKNHGAKIALSYQGERLAKRVTDMGVELGSDMAFQCDVSSDEEIRNMFNEIKKSWEKIDILVHSVAFAPQDQLQGSFVENVSREGFKIAHDISSYSLAALAKEALPLMKDNNSSIMTVTYLGSTRAFPNYNTMGPAKASLEATTRYLANSMGPYGIRVNAISAGPIKTLAAAGINSFKKILDFNKKYSPMRENVTIEQVGNASSFICSDLASAITGEVIHVDNGFHIVGLANMENETNDV